MILAILAIILILIFVLCLWYFRSRTIKRNYPFSALPTEKVEIYSIKNFLSEEECDELCRLIDEHAIRSTVSGGDTGYVLSDSRTSYTASLYDHIPFVKMINEKLHKVMNIPNELGEVIQGQRYSEGQEFKFHYDYFMPEDFKHHCKDLGQRTYTFMIYLNEPEEGGATVFKHLDTTFKPEKGMAVVWNNLYENGDNNQNTMHCGEPVKKGMKYIITKWFRKPK